ncbi:MAG TPA: ABC transporter substrate-binding protein [Fibrobacteraceae bacterium]|nr:ABC transporter substrate-binding protein [Fibrobacteraceae bacterium]
MLSKSFAVLLVCGVFAFAAQDPAQLIKTKDQELQVLLKKKAHSQKETETIKHLINDIFDFQLLARKSLPSATWKGLNDSSRSAFVKDFQRMVENSSVKKLEMYKADSTRYDPAIVKTDEAKVIAHVWNKGKESVLVYKLDLVNGSWRAWDLIIDDLSTARNYRDQFSKILETKTFAELLTTIQKKADEGS